MDPEGHPLARSTATDVTGEDLDDHAPGFRAEVLERYPRLDFTRDLLAYFRARAEREPDSSPAGAVRTGLATVMAANPLDAPSGPSPGREAVSPDGRGARGPRGP
ncbi:hypothetical protein [Streptomyces sp. SBT349]|uniref:hypothetical protein n=1 Tax=Streptomyces sp. SBT349 TaxID=1580539 RepID=UPI000AEC81D2|nr:hypothetical protein [Streptomyces sp. SBT349]